MTCGMVLGQGTFDCFFTEVDFEFEVFHDFVWLLVMRSQTSVECL